MNAVDEAAVELLRKESPEALARALVMAWLAFDYLKALCPEVQRLMQDKPRRDLRRRAR